MTKQGRQRTNAPTPATETPLATPGITVHKVLWLVACFAWLLVAASMLSHTPDDRFGHAAAGTLTDTTREAANWIGAFGAFLASELFLMLGSGAWVLLALAALALVLTAVRPARLTTDHRGEQTTTPPVPDLSIRAVGALALALAVSGAHALLAPMWTSAPEGAGGLAMIALTAETTEHLGRAGTALTLAFIGLLGAWVVFDRWLYLAPAKAAAFIARRTTSAANAAKDAASRAAAQRANDIDDDNRLRSVEKFVKGAAAKRQRAIEIDEQAGGLGGAETFDHTKQPAESRDNDDDEHAATSDAEYEDENTGDEDWYDDDEDAPGAPQVFDREALKEKISKLPVRFASADRKQATQEDLDILRAQRKSEEEADRAYQFPGLDLLEDPEENFNAQLEEWVRDQAEALEQALQTYRIEGEVVGIESGPVITLYRVRLAPGTKVSQVTPVTSDIARMLKAVNIRVVPNEAGTDTVGIEVPNLRKEKVRLKELMTNSGSASRMKLPMFLGKDASGNPLVIDLASLPHLLIAGTTGSGKSVAMNAIISGFLYTQKPSDLKLVLVDPKMVELSQFKDIPHLMCPVVTEMGKAAAILEWAVTKMDERYELLAEAGVRDIAGYNALDWEELKERFNPGSELEEAKIPRKLPYMVFIIDELADLMMTNKEVEGSIVRIAQKARAVGIHLILATQRPQANVVTGLIKSNMPGRIAFKVASGMDSRIVLDQKGGELLLGHGDMLMLTPRSGITTRAQGTLVDDAEIRKVVRFVRDVSSPTYERDLATIDNHGYDPNDPEAHDDARAFTAAEYEERMRKSAQEDPLFDRAVEIVLETKRGSVSLLQRRLAIGYTRASRLIELMGMCGIIGKHKGSVAREVMMTPEEWEAMKQLAEEERQANAQAEQASLFEDGREEGAQSGDEANDPQNTDPNATHAAANQSANNPTDHNDPFETNTPATGAAAMLENKSEMPPFTPDDHDTEDHPDPSSQSHEADPPEPDHAEPTDEGTTEDETEQVGEPKHTEAQDSAEDQDPAGDDETQDHDTGDDADYVYIDEDGNEIPASELDEDDAESESEPETENDSRSAT